MPDLYNYWWRITYFEYSTGKKETCMFYIANIMTLSIVLEFLWKLNLLVRYKLNIFHPPRVNQFDICALLFDDYDRFIPLDKTVFYGYWKALTSGSLSVLHIDLTFSRFVMDSVVVFLIMISIILIVFSTSCVSIIALVAETILFSWLLVIVVFFWPSYHVTSVCKF